MPPLVNREGVKPKTSATNAKYVDPVKTAAPGSILSKGIPASDIRDTYIKMLLYGGNGIGKTTLCCGLVDSKGGYIEGSGFPRPLLHIAMERSPTGGARSIRRVPGVTVIRPGAKDWDSPIDSKACVDELFRLAHELSAKNPFQTVVFDHLTTFQEHVLEAITGKPTPVQNAINKVSTDDYTERAEKVKTYLVPWLDMACHTVFIGKEKDHNPPKEEKITASGKKMADLRPKFIRGMQAESFVSVELGGSAAGWVQDAVDFACRLYMDKEMERTKTTVNGVDYFDARETGKFIRCLRTGYHPNFFSRFRSDYPENMPDAIENPTFAKILACIEGRYKS